MALLCLFNSATCVDLQIITAIIYFSLMYELRHFYFHPSTQVVVRRRWTMTEIGTKPGNWQRWHHQYHYLFVCVAYVNSRLHGNYCNCSLVFWRIFFVRVEVSKKYHKTLEKYRRLKHQSFWPSNGPIYVNILGELGLYIVISRGIVLGLNGQSFYRIHDEFWTKSLDNQSWA